MPDGYLRPVPEPFASTADGWLRVPATQSGFPAPASAICTYAWAVPRDPSASDALPLSPTGGRLRPPCMTGADIGNPPHYFTVAFVEVDVLFATLSGHAGGVGAYWLQYSRMTHRRPKYRAKRRRT